MISGKGLFVIAGSVCVSLQRRSVCLTRHEASGEELRWSTKRCCCVVEAVVVVLGDAKVEERIQVSLTVYAGDCLPSLKKD